MIFSLTRFLSVLWRFLRSPALLLYTLAYFMLVLVIGTIAQKEIGLFTATHLFFNRFFFWIGPVPVPVGASALLVLFINLSCHFIASSRWEKHLLGSSLTHLSVLVLLFGGGLTLVTKQEGFVLLQQDQPTATVYDYHRRDLVIYRNAQEIIRIPANHLQPNNLIELPERIPLRVTVRERCDNCRLNEQGKLEQLAARPDDEVNQWGMMLAVHNPHDGKTPVELFAVTEFSAPHLLYRYKPQNGGQDVTYSLALRRHSWDLPFSLTLDAFIQEHHTGTAIASHYESALYVQDRGATDRPEWPARIAMNDPLRYRGFTLYQSSVLTLPDGELASVLNVVKNAGWLFPYLASFLFFAGMILHLGVRRHAPQ